MFGLRQSMKACEPAQTLTTPRSVHARPGLTPLDWLATKRRPGGHTMRCDTLSPRPRHSRSILALAFMAAALLPLPIAAQVALPTQAPAVLSVFCESLRPGTAPDYDTHNIAWSRQLEQIPNAPPLLALRRMSGTQEVCYMSGLASFAASDSAEKIIMGDAAYTRALPGLERKNAAYVSGSRAMYAAYRGDLAAGSYPDLMKRRVYMWTEFRVRQGAEEAFDTAAKAYRALFARKQLPAEWRVYQVVAGAQGATYWVFESFPDMSGMDKGMADGMKATDGLSEAERAAFKTFNDALTFVRTDLWRVSSGLTAMSAAVRGDDPFWKRPALAPKAATKPKTP